ncbi:DUF188 domain-containing protein [Fictibacillus nanhaiensis]|uniref:YaiI/YqxD family protein n=1 Tax=Fictibacillus nanhaiensis TaxID=742169 RepID=UPI001C961EF0|nr:DUF188 domain-containing protein [Fictibacillus nanhaiensis]MBY6035452.1 DUF188 domain-containing protein [Fictibacillus nanhaiensis]
MEKFIGNVFVDADACPVLIKDEINKCSQVYLFEPIYVTSFAHASNTEQPGRWILVDARPEEVDMYIHNHSKKKDIVVTQDHALASLLIPKGVYVITPRGKHFQEDEMERVLHERYLSAKARRSGMHSKGPTKFTKEDAKRFHTVFCEILSNVEGN